MPDSELHSLPNGRSRGDLAPAQLPDPPRLPAPCLEPWAAPSFLALQPGTKMAWQGCREKEAASIPTACCLFLMVNGSSITASHRSQGGLRAAQGPWARELHRCHHSWDSAGAQTMLQHAVSAREGWDISLMRPSSRFFLLCTWFSDLQIILHC